MDVNIACIPVAGGIETVVDCRWGILELTFFWPSQIGTDGSCSCLSAEAFFVTFSFTDILFGLVDTGKVVTVLGTETGLVFSSSLEDKLSNPHVVLVNWCHFLPHLIHS